jgi:DNA repair protein RecO (recombination protein O)
MKAMIPSAAYILNRRIYKESSLLLDVFSYDYGRHSILARSSLKSTQGWSAILQVFQPLLLSWTGRSSLKTLVSVEAPSAAIALHNERLFSAYYLNELIIKLVGISMESSTVASSSRIVNTAHQNIFLAYAQALSGLQTEENIEVPLRRFEYLLLEDLGIFPDFRQDIYGSAINADLNYQLVPQQGFVAITSIGARINDRLEIQGRYLQLFEHELNDVDHLSEDQRKPCLQQLKKLMRALIEEVLEGKELKSRRLFQRYQPNRSMS